MDEFIKAKFNFFLAPKGLSFASLSANQKGAEFESFCTDSILRRFHRLQLTPDERETTLVGGSYDNQIDSVSILLGETLIQCEEQLDESLLDGDEAIEIVFIQCTTFSKFDHQKMITFGNGVQMFLQNDGFFQENPQLSERRSLTHSLLERFLEEDSPNIVVHLYYVCLGKWTQDSVDPQGNESGWRGWARKQISRCGLHPGNIEVVDERRFRETLQVLSEPPENPSGVRVDYEGRLPASPFVEIPLQNTAGQGFSGYAIAEDYIRLLERPDRMGMLEGIADHNIRGFKGYNVQVNRRIAETLTGPDRSQFYLRNNGVTLLADEAFIDPQDQVLVLKNYQIVNGLQTSHVLYHLREELQGATDVLVPLKIAVSSDSKVQQAVSESTNLQTAVTYFDFLSRYPTVRQVESSFLASGDDLIFERRQGQYWDLRGEERNHLITLTELMLAFASVFLEMPHEAKKGKAKVVKRVPNQIFTDHHPPDLYLSAGKLYYLARKRCQANDAQGLPSFAFHCAFALRVGLLTKGFPHQSPTEALATYGETLLAALEDSSAVEETLEKAFSVTRDFAHRTKKGNKNHLVLAESTTSIRKQMA
ncbi:MAG: AIPR family protein [Verrucomicrobiota bacterium]